MALLRSAVRHKHWWSIGGDTYIGCWQHIPPKLGNALVPVSYIGRPTVNEIPKDWVLRGSGLHGPENADVMKLVLWNRLKQRRPQRICTTESLQEFFRMEVALVWWMFGLVFFMAPMNWWAKRYSMVHDHYPWMPKRLDGSRGPGSYCWFIE
eukprot:CAMPEP_0178467936 /NCGR_PEP_ID=MMETSP0689_2-20121128/52665_1 /TAXON_ID=160604 /ORGANISM="Amphidinium massartii, Strain CS-259" /LENGTH=151 /DNA_ID=CAMNT_0020094985 /DNA_START=204 /DNA_END=659 /DNA_ORIENTATION=-